MQNLTPTQIEADQCIRAMKCKILHLNCMALNMADCYIIQLNISDKLKPCIDEYVDAHLLSATDAHKHIHDVFGCLHDKIREIYTSKTFNN